MCLLPAAEVLSAEIEGDQTKATTFILTKAVSDKIYVVVVEKAFHKETKTTTHKEGNTVVNQIEERSSWRLGTGRGTTPDDQSILRTNGDLSGSARSILTPRNADRDSLKIRI